MRTPERRGTHRLLSLLAVIGLLFLLSPPPFASAHGEQGQQAFERTSTVLFYDVHFSTTNLNIGDPLTITGTLRVMDSWPDHTIAPPDLGYLTVNQPGPVLSVQERWLSGMFTPQSVKLVKGGVYPFKLVLKARIPGTWHVHPAMAVKGTGTLMGPGEWITINNVGTFTEPQQLADGRVVDLAHYGISRVAVWHLIGFLMGAAYLAYWLRKPTLQRAIVVNGGGAAGLVTKKERRVSIGFAIAALLIGVVGFLYATLSDGPHIPLQVARLAPVPELPNALGAGLHTTVEQAVFQEKAGTLQMTVKVRNDTASPVYFDHLQFADFIVTNADGAPASVPPDRLATISPAGPIPPKETRELKVTLDARALRQQNLLPLNDAQIRLTGLMFFRDASGQTSATEINELTSGILPQYG